MITEVMVIGGKPLPVRYCVAYVLTDLSRHVLTTGDRGIARLLEDVLTDNQSVLFVMMWQEVVIV